TPVDRVGRKRVLVAVIDDAGERRLDAATVDADGFGAAVRGLANDRLLLATAIAAQVYGAGIAIVAASGAAGCTGLAPGVPASAGTKPARFDAIDRRVVHW